MESLIPLRFLALIGNFMGTVVIQITKVIGLKVSEFPWHLLEKRGNLLAAVPFDDVNDLYSQYDQSYNTH